MYTVSTGVVYAILLWIDSTGIVEMPQFVEPEKPVVEVPGAGEIEPKIIPIDKLPSVVVGEDDILYDEMIRCYMARAEIIPDEKVMRDSIKGLDGFYCENRVVLRYYDDLFVGPSGMVSLVHELVHWMQYHNGDWDYTRRCTGYLEWDAYAVQHAWQATHGIEVYPGAFTAWARSQCGDRSRGLGP